MKIALYSNSKQLPSNFNPSEPDCYFDPSTLETWRDLEHWNPTIKKYSEGPATEHWYMPVLLGLAEIEIPGIMAHVSIIFNEKEKTIKMADRFVAQITTVPKKINKNGLPMIVKAVSLLTDTLNETQVKHLWGDEDGCDIPTYLLNGESSNYKESSRFWREFFIKSLREKKEMECTEAREMLSEAWRILKKYAIIP